MIAARALETWKLQKLLERRADVAGSAFMVALRYVDAIRQMSSSLIPPGEQGRSDMQILSERWSLFEKLDTPFNDQISLVRVHLGMREAHALDSIWKFRCRMYAMQHSIASLSGNPDPHTFAQGYGSCALEGLDGLVQHVETLLQPHIRMQTRDHRDEPPLEKTRL